MKLNPEVDWLDINKLVQPSKYIYIELDSLSIPNLNIVRDSVYLQVEPNAIINAREFLLKNSSRFKYIITYDDIVLNSVPNAVKYLYGTTWIKEENYNNIDISLKNFKISTLVGFKNWTPGHNLRQELYNKQKELSDFPLTIYRSNHGMQLQDISNNLLLPNDNKLNLFIEFQFSVVIENSQQANYFTEKLVDCLITKTIPVYWGCPNIPEYFDTTGWIIFSDLNDLKHKLLVLDSTYYSKYTEVINKNYETAKLYTDFHENVNRAIQTIPDW
jgi:hypothetical protein